MSNPIILGAESVRAELAEAPGSHDLTEKQAEFIQQLPDDEIDRAIQDVADDHFWDAYDSVRRDAITRIVDEHRRTLASLGDDLVLITDVDGDDYERAFTEANKRGGSVRDAAVEYLAQWDFGDENDNAAEVNGYTQLEELQNHPHMLHEVDHGGLHYWLQLDHGLRFYALYRRPLGPAAPITTVSNTPEGS